MVECSKRQDTSCPFCRAVCESKQQVSVNEYTIDLYTVVKVFPTVCIY